MEMNKKDVSARSMTILEERASALLGEIWVPDWNQAYNRQDKISSVLLMGSYFEKVFHLEDWPDADFSLYVLSPRVKAVLVSLYGFDQEKVGVLSRYEMFPASGQETPFSFNEGMSLYYSGRLSPQKNIEFLVLSAFYLQMLYSEKISLKMFGEFDNEYHKDILNCPFGDYKNRIEKLIESLPWPGEKPSIHKDLNETQWLEFIPSNGVFLSCSNLISEDFSVVAAQLQGIGKPMIVPSWGGFNDLRGSNVRHFSVDLIGHSHEDFKVMNQKAKAFAAELIQGHYYLLNNSDNTTYRPSEKMNRDYLKEKMSDNRKRYGQAADFLIERNLPAFASSEAGQVFFKECREIFKGLR